MPSGPDNFFIDRAGRRGLHVSSADTKCWITTSFEHLTRFIVDCVLVPAMANFRVAIAEPTVSAADFAVMLSKASARACQSAERRCAAAEPC